MMAIRDCGISMHAVVSSEDILIHPTASMTLAKILNCDFSYLAGGHMSHVENTDVVVERLMNIWEKGLDRKYPQYKKFYPSNTSINRAMSMGNPSVISHAAHSNSNRNKDWPLSEEDTIEILHRLVNGKMDTWSLYSIIKRLNEPGRLFLAPALLFPILIIQARKILSGKLSKSERTIEIALLTYIFWLVFVVHEVTREQG
jgi:hypothetical protein